MGPVPRVARLVFGREPAAWLAAAESALALVVAFGLPLSVDQTGAVLAVLTAALSLLTAWAVHPVAPAVFVGAGKAVLALVVSFGLAVPAEQQGAILAALSVFLALVLRQQVSPPVPSGAEPTLAIYNDGRVTSSVFPATINVGAVGNAGNADLVAAEITRQLGRHRRPEA